MNSKESSEINAENFVMKCEAIIGNHYFDIAVGFQCTRFSVQESH